MYKNGKIMEAKNLINWAALSEWLSQKRFAIRKSEPKTHTLEVLIILKALRKAIRQIEKTRNDE